MIEILVCCSNLNGFQVAYPLNLICNGVWGIIFAYEIMWLSVVVMIIILMTLIFMYVRLDIGRGLGAIDVWKICFGENT